MTEWRNWKTGAKIGFIYGVICALYFAPIIFIQFSPTPDHPIKMCDDTCTSLYKIIGLIFFFPLVFFSTLFAPFYKMLHVYMIIILNSVIVIIAGTVFGAVIGYLLSHRSPADKET